MKQLIICYLGEVVLKGLNKSSFEAQIMKAIRQRVKNLGEFKIYKSQSVIYVEPIDEFCDIDTAYDKIRKIFGIATISKAVVVKKDFEEITNTVLESFSDVLENTKTFKVVARRSDKNFGMTSTEIARELGGRILSKHYHLKVDVHNPQTTVMVEIRETAAYVHLGKQKAAGGMPVSSSGKAALMLSGGIDSPVAAYMMAKRGLALMSVHFASPPYTSERAKQKVVSLCEKLVDYTGKMPLLIVEFTEVQEYIRDNGVPELFTVLMRRSMMRITEILSDRYGAGAIVTGESLAQVASQTLSAIRATNQSVDIPILRPLIGMDKTEIVAISREIDTYETSILPYEDCCTIFTPAHPKTKPKMEEILGAEEKMDMQKLLELENKAMDNIERIFIDIE